MAFQSQMQLEHFCVVNLEIKTKPYKANRASGVTTTNKNIGISFDVLRNEESPKFLIPLKIEVSCLDENDCVEKIAIEINGGFSFPEGISEDEIRKYVPLLCLTNLFGIARGIIAQATSLCCDGPFLLPLVNMNEVIKQKILKTSEKHISEKDITKKTPQIKKLIPAKNKPSKSKARTKKKQTK